MGISSWGSLYAWLVAIKPALPVVVVRVKQTTDRRSALARDTYFILGKNLRLPKARPGDWHLVQARDALHVSISSSDSQ